MGDIQETRNELTFPATQILGKDLVELKNLSEQRQQELYRNIRDNKEEYEWEFYPAHREVIPEATKEKELAAFEAAKLLLATAIEDGDGSPTSGLVDEFEAEEREFVREFDDFRRKFKQVDESTLERSIKNEEGEVYEFVTEEIESQADLEISLLDTSENEIRGAAISYFQREFDEFFDLANQAVFLYIKHHGLPNTIEGVVDAAEVTADASDTREQVEETVRRQLETLSESLHEDLREQERTLRARMSHLENEVATAGRDDGVEHELAAINDQLDDLADRRSADADEIAERLETVQSLEADLEAKIDELEAARERAVEEVRAETESEARTLLEDELERLHEQKADLDGEIERLRSERERLASAGDRLDREFGDLEERVATAEERVEDTERRLDDDVDDLEARLDSITESLRTETNEHEGKAVRAKIARLYEMDYVARFETSVKEAASISLPDSETFEAPDGYWDDQRRHLTGDHRSVVTDALEDDGETADRYPVGRYSVFRVVTNKFVAFSETKLVVEAVVKSNLEAFATNGFDARPAGVDDLLDVVNQTLARAESNDTAHLIGIASPTGWTDEVRDLVRGDDLARTTYSDRVSACLVDLQSNDLIYDANDPLVADNVGLFEREVDSERVAACVETIRDAYADDPMVDVVQHHEVVDEHGYEPHIVREAFERLAADGHGRTGYPNAARGFCLLLE
ncbi:hypothetical protein EFA46_015140 (plasmid) [Halarchaeum sp. CBA1220]|uniref:hypothetical protein n=1 Tax=Halarchaeum sp. CBA1220 TaxID=1853682 RepID=UPI000F3A83E5|nr:hypothetical protein [Halarchaeum sp. CBA1220]QLC35562.1 hypothetical protein EFA46_015140 [Halarchaeum sp. CBA1220]